MNEVSSADSDVEGRLKSMYVVGPEPPVPRLHPERRDSPYKEPATSVVCNRPTLSVTAATPTSPTSAPPPLPPSDPTPTPKPPHLASQSVAPASPFSAFSPALSASCSEGVTDRTNTQSPSPFDGGGVPTMNLHFHGASWEPQPRTRRWKLRSGERTAARGFIWLCPLCHKQKTMSRDGLIKHLTMMHPSSVRRKIPLTRESISRFDESPTVPDEDFMYVLSAYFTLPDSSTTGTATTSL
ncbi:uncharacterized protein C8Q71DRAFT_388897 [Rhodofomes roseus]|uniref:BED-type domain-containing protein n=1 Tax=Rhodofomes roseus TaxID=34475 RepID=A0ABQ8K072_9APHY|nr:uncharacterized protein C8Q71DRAFT_388897 [Rhodofomes roseus]KAH9829817.1 hypothetical protein C8Q71DRAFT_388897 [Rhodofomes roseus]